MRTLPVLLIGVLAVSCGAQPTEESAPPSEKIGTAESAATFDNWKGAEQLVLTAVQPNIARCGAPPAAFEFVLEGTGVDNAGGPFQVTATGCLNPATGFTSDLVATDTYLKTGDSVTVLTADFYQVPDPATCAYVNEAPLAFTVGGGTGQYAGATGKGTFNIAIPDAQCAGGTPVPAHVWFQGHLKPAK